jgi:hypothetical protein
MSQKPGRPSAAKRLADEAVGNTEEAGRQTPILSRLLNKEPPAESPPGIPAGIPESIPVGIPSGIPASIPTQAEPRKPAETFTPLDATHTASEKSVYSVMYRETISKGATERRFGPAELMAKTGIRSRNTVHRALYGLVEKLSVEVVEEARGNTFGPRYRVYRPQEVEQRRKAVGMTIDPQSKRVIPGIPAGIPTGIPAATPKTEYPSGDTTIPISGTHIKEDQIKDRSDDDEAFAELRALAKELTGREAADWSELDKVLAAELRIAAARTTVSSVPAFLAEHLRRRLWKADKRQARAEGRELPDSAPAVAAQAPRECPDCKGSGWWYPEGQERGVAKCRHEKLKAEG